MLCLFFSLISCDWIEYPNIQIGNPEVSVKTHTKRTFRTMALAKPYIKSIVGDSEKAQQVLNKLNFVKKYSVDINSMSGDKGNNIDRDFSRDHLVLSIKKDEKGVTTDFANVNVKVRVHAEQILHATKTKKKLFGLIRKHYTVRINQWRALKASELTQIYDKMNKQAAGQLQTAIAKVKSDK